MSTILSTGALTLADWAKRVDDDKIAIIINILSQQNAILEDMLWIEGNLPTGHKTTVRTGLPSATWRLFNAGVQPTKSTTAQIVDTCGMLETYSDIDCALAELGGDISQIRMSEDLAFIEGMNQQLASALFYSNALATPQQIMGLSPRYNTVTTTTAQSANNVIDGSGTGSVNTSLWLLSWGPNNMTGIFPKGQISGLQHRDLGEQTLYTAVSTTGAPTMLQVYRTHFKWNCGLSVRDWRFGVRLCNIDTTNLIAGTGVNLINGMVRMINRLPIQPGKAGPVQDSDAPQQLEVGRAAFYCNRTVLTYLDIQALNKSNALLTINDTFGRPRLEFRGIPVRCVDAITNTESRIT